MPLAALRFAGDPVLEACVDGARRLLLNDEGIAVGRIQAALEELGFAIGAAGVDGIFGVDTGSAVTAFKQSRGLVPDDPVVGVGTMTALDAAFAADPLLLDPLFGRFTPFVRERRIEPFAAATLKRFLDQPADGWAAMIANLALAGLATERLAGIVAASRFDDLAPFFFAHADPVQDDGLAPGDWFARERAGFIGPDGRPLNFRGSGVTFDFRGQGGFRIGLIVLSDELILNRAHVTAQITGQRLRERLDLTLAHELTHMRNADQDDALLATLDQDVTAWIDPFLAFTLSTTTPVPTATVLMQFAQEVSARHVEWHVRQELNGLAGTIPQLTAEELAGAVIRYLADFPGLFDGGNGYVHAINARPDGVAARLLQAALWIRKLEPFRFSDDATQEALVHDRLRRAADLCEAQGNAGATVDPPAAAGLTPLLVDFP